MYCPPRPRPLPAVASLIRVMLQGDGDLLSLLPSEAYRIQSGPLGYSRRSILVVNAPELVREVLNDPAGIFPKSDLMVGALEPLVGTSIFVSSGDAWRRQRRMIEPAFTQMRVGRAFLSMSTAIDDYEVHLDSLAARDAPFSLDLAMSHLTADIICRTVFSTSLASQTAREVFDAFTLFERSVAQVQLRRLILDPAWTPIPQSQAVLAACANIRSHLGALLDTHLGEDAARFDDIAAAVIAARDLDSGHRFDRKELIDELGVMFLAGHETTASVLTWAFLILATQSDVLARVREEVDAVVGDAPVGFEHLKRLPYVRNVFRETMRLYPPITFIPRVAAEKTRIGHHAVKKGAMIMISPWIIHRHRDYWPEPHGFDPDRFSAAREGQLVQGAYLPFGLGPRVCAGASFATAEATLILARLARRYEFRALDVASVRPVARLTTRPARQITCHVQPRRR